MRERHNTCSISIKTEREREFYEKDGSNYAHFFKREIWGERRSYGEIITYKSRE